MKLVVKREPFAQAMTAAGAIVPLRSVRANLRYALLTANSEGHLEIQATDLEVGLRYRIKAESIKDPSNLCLPCLLLGGLLKVCTEEVVSLETDGAKGVLKAGRDPFEVFGRESSDFPEIPDFGDGPVVPVLAADLKAMIDRTIFAAAKEQGRYAINGIFLQAKDKLLEMVATDGRRLAFCKRKLKGAEGLDEGVIVPLKMIQEIRKLCELAKEGSTIDLAIRGRSVLARSGDITLSSLLVEGIFPKYQQVIPKDTDVQVSFKREDLKKALQKADLMTSDETRTVSLTFTAGSCLIEARSADKGQAAVTLEVDYTGDKMTVAFNPKYLLDCLNVLTADSVKLEMKDPSRPGLIREGAEYLYVLMPVTTKD